MPCIEIIGSSASGAAESRTDLMDLDALSKIPSSTAPLSSDDFSDFSMSASSTSPPLDSAPTTSFDPILCVGCGYDIRDRFVLKVMDESWHESCLRCFACQMPLSASGTCFAKDGHIYCREDHAQIFGRKCGRCGVILQPADLVFRCVHNTYHQACFSCAYCGVLFKKGDEYHIVDGEALCRADYQMICQNAAAHLQLPGLYDYDGLSESSRKTPKRPRTILNAQQRRQFKLAFEKSAKPCRKVREQLAKETGLSVRVVQVWFQNQRAKMKKIQRKEATNGSTGSGGCSDMKSADDIKSESDEGLSDSEAEELENKKTTLTSLDFKQQQEVYTGGPPAAFLHPSAIPVTPIDKLYNMHNTYFNYV